METCPICKLQDNRVTIKDVDVFGKKIICPRCNEFTILFYPEFEEPDQRFGPKLSAWIRNHNEQGKEGPEVNPQTLEDLQRHIPNYSPREKQIILLKNIERKTEYPGQIVELNWKYDFPLAWAANNEEFLYYIESLHDRGFINNEMTSGSSGVTITANGWDYLEYHERHLEERTQAFVAMSFAEDLKSIWEGPIYRAIKKAGYEPYRVDAKPHSERIDAKIISEIKNSRFVVADVTKQRQGVYFEAGYALGIGLPVIWCVKEDELKDVHFDTRQYNHIDWKSESDLEIRLYDFICAIIGKVKEAP